MVSPGFARASTGVTIKVNDGSPVAAGDVVTAVVWIGGKEVPASSDPDKRLDKTSVGFEVTGYVPDPLTDPGGNVVSNSDIVGDATVGADGEVGDTSIEYSASGLDPGGGKKYSAEIIIPPISSATTTKSRPNSFWFIPEIVDNGI